MPLFELILSQSGSMRKLHSLGLCIECFLVEGADFDLLDKLFVGAHYDPLSTMILWTDKKRILFFCADIRSRVVSV